MNSQSSKPTASNNRRMLRNTFCLTAMLGIAAVLSAQSPNSIQIPYASTVAGLPTATPVLTVCSTSTTDSDGSIGNTCPPAQAKLNGPRSLYIDPATGNLFIADYGYNQIREIYNSGANELQRLVNGYNNTKVVSTTSVIPGNIYNACGAYSGSYTSIGTGGGSCGNTKLTPTGVGMDAVGNIYESEGNRMRVLYLGGAGVTSLINNTTGHMGTVSPKSGYEYPIIYSSLNGYYGDGGPAINALTNNAKGIWVDASGNIYIADSGSNAIRMINGATGIIGTIAGTGCTPAIVTTQTVGTDFNVPLAISVAGGCTSGVAGNGVPATSANLKTPYDVIMDASGNLYIADYGNALVRAIYMGSGSIPGVSSPQLGYIYTVAGGGVSTTGGPALSTKFTTVSGIGFDAAGNLYIGDYTAGKIWEVDAKTQVAALIAGGGAGAQGTACSTSFAAGPTRTYANGDGCLGTLATLGAPYGRIAFDAQGNLYVADYTANVVREFSHKVLAAATTPVGGSAPMALGFASLNSSTITLSGATFGVKGVSSTDFNDAGGSSCNTLNQTLVSGAACYLNILFKPTLPGLRQGGALVMTTGGTTMGTNYIEGIGTGAEVAFDSATPVTVGSGTTPQGIAADPSGVIYVADKTSNSVLRYASATATTPTSLITGLLSPTQVAVDGEGNVYVADTGNNRIAVYNATTTAVSYITGGYSAPQGVIVDGFGSIFVSDTGNNRVVRITSTGAVSVVTSALSTPTQLALDSNGNVYVVNSGTSQVMQITGTLNNTLVPVALGQFNAAAIGIDAAGDYYVLDKSGLQVGYISAQGATTTTLLSGMTSPSALAVDALGNVYIADASAGVTYLNRQQITVPFYPLNVGQSSTFNSFITTNIGSTTLNYTGSAPFSAAGSTADFSVFASTNNGCSVSTPLTAGNWCSISATFSPVATGSFSDVLTIPSNAANTAAATSALTGKGVSLNNSNLTISSTPSGSISYGTPIKLTFALQSGTPAATGQIIVQVGGIKVATLTVVNGAAAYTFSPQAGTYVIAGQYTGDANYVSSYATLSLTVLPAATSTSLSYSGALLSVQGTNIPAYTLTATATSSAAGLTGVVDFCYSSQSPCTATSSSYLGYGALNTSGVATLTVACATQTNCPAINGTSSTPIANPTFTASYQAHSNYAGSTSSGVNVQGDLGMTALATSLAEPQGALAQTLVNVTPYMGLSGTVTFSCSNLPQNAGCRFLTCPTVPQAGFSCPVQSNTQLAFSGYTVTTNPSTGSSDVQGQLTLEIFTNVSPTTAERRTPAPTGHRREMAECGLTLLGGLLLLGLRRRTPSALRKLTTVALIVLLPLLAGLGLAACGSGNNYYDYPSVTTPVSVTTINSITAGNPGVFNVAGNTFTTGQMVYLYGFTTDTALNGQFYNVTSTTSTGFTLTTMSSPIQSVSVSTSDTGFAIPATTITLTATSSNGSVESIPVNFAVGPSN
jgi:sugar lactone lactonase YvrE